MSRFADPTATDRLVLGPCACPGTPHAEDWVDLRTQLSGADWYVVAQGDTGRTLALIVTGWNLCDADGAVSADAEHLDAIDLTTFQAIDSWIASHLTFPTLPNASAAPSPGSSRPSGSPTRQRKKAA